MIKAALIIGLSMGRQYASWLEQLGYKAVTVDIDPARNADYTNYADAVRYQRYDIIYIGTPNFTHEVIARDVAKSTRILLIEKPGVEDSTAWKNLVEDNPDTRILMVKNNQYRLELSGFKDLLKIAKRVNVVWSRLDGIPASPWFKAKDLAFGGVSRDLMPHLLSYYTALTNHSSGTKLYADSVDRHQTGIDDFCEIEIKNNNVTWTFTASWKNNRIDDHYIEFDFGESKARFQLGDHVTAFGGCPASPYMTMIQTAVNNVDNDEFWQQQLEQDLWIHKQIERL